MIVYKDIVSGDEILTDVYKMNEVDDVFYVVEGKLTVESNDMSDALFGANPSAEGEEEQGCEASAESGVNIVIANRLVETVFTKSDFKKTLKTYLAKVVEKLNPERIPEFKAGAKARVLTILSEFSEWQFYTGESMDPEGMIVLLKYSMDGNGVEKPFLYYWKDGLVAEKV